jgi:hypothetical protein
MTYNIRAASEKDVYAIAPLLREADKAEIKAMTGSSPLIPLLTSFNESDIVWFAYRPDGSPLAIFGVGKDIDCAAGIPWMLATDEAKRFAVSLVKMGQKWVDRRLSDYGLLHNFVDSRNTVHINWLKRLGFTINPEPHYIGHDKSVPFLFFHRSN